MQSKEVTITNPSGLHARACARIVEVASRFSCQVSLVLPDRRASARSILAVLLLSASVGTALRIEAEGPEADHALREIARLFHTGFGENA